MPDIRDIKDIVDIPDYSIYILLFFAVAAIMVFLIFIYNVIHKILSDKKRRIKKAVLKRLKEVDFSDPKRAAYEITKYGRYLVHDDKSKRIFEELNEMLERYKYKKSVDEKIARKVVRYYYLLIEAVDE